MKYAQFIVVFLVLLYSCKHKEAEVFQSGKFYPEVERRSVVIGQIENISEYSDASRIIRLYVDDIAIDNQSLFITDIDDSGKFVFDIPLHHSTNTYLDYCDGTEVPYLFPDDTLFITCKVLKSGSLVDIRIVKYDVKHAKFQKEFQKHYYWVHSQIKAFKDQLSQKSTPVEQKNKYLVFEQELYKSIDSRIQKDSSTQFFFDYMRYTTKYYILKDVIRLGKDIKDPVEKSLFFSFLEDSVVFNDKAFITSSYRNFLNHYGAFVEPSATIRLRSDHKTKEKLDQERILKRLEDIKALRKGIWAEYLAASAIYNSVITKEEEFSVAAIDFYLQLVKERFSDKYIQQLLLSMLTMEQKSIMAREKSALPRGVKEKSAETSAPGEILFHEILNSNQGKVIYVDVWATWCSPCMQQFPYSKILHERFAGKDVAFVYLCCRSQKETSLNVIKKLQLQGEHYFLSREQYEYFEKKFQIAGIPRYLLISKSGTVVNSNASRPDSEITFTEITKLLNE